MDIREKLELAIKNPYSAKSYKWALNILLKEVGPKKEYTSWDVLKVLQKFKPNTAHVLYYLLKKIFKIAGWEWDESILASAPKIDPDEVMTPVLDKKLIIESILNAGKLDNVKQAIWVLSTVWGMRRVEIKRILSDTSLIDLDSDPPRVKIQTAKGGKTRPSLIPPEVVDKLAKIKGKNYDISIFTLNTYFHQIMMETTGKWAGRGYGYHSVRRSLITYLLPPHTPLSDAEVFRFMRWAHGAAGGMSILYRYAYTAKEAEWFEIDRKIYQYHPWLKYWKGVS